MQASKTQWAPYLGLVLAVFLVLATSSSSAARPSDMADSSTSE
jgi:hypothetical protein